MFKTAVLQLFNGKKWQKDGKEQDKYVLKENECGLDMLYRWDYLSLMEGNICTISHHKA